MEEALQQHTLEEMEFPSKSLFLPAHYTRAYYYQSHISFKVKSGDYTIKTAEKVKHLFKIFKLRYLTFFKAIGAKKKFHIDVDDFDFKCDHIVIYDEAEKKMAGTYRVLSSKNTKEFYSEKEFILDEFKEFVAPKLELGRACVHPDYRDKPMIDYLLRGITHYVKLSGARYLFGCCSIWSTDQRLAKTMYEYLRKEGKVKDDWNIRPVEHMRMNFEEIDVYPMSDSEIKKQIPPLLRTYLNMGGHVYGRPALDRPFRSFDFFIMLDIKNISSAWKRRYFTWSS